MSLSLAEGGPSAHSPEKIDEAKGALLTMLCRQHAHLAALMAPDIDVGKWSDKIVIYGQLVDECGEWRTTVKNVKDLIIDIRAKILLAADFETADAPWGLVKSELIEHAIIDHYHVMNALQHLDYKHRQIIADTIGESLIKALSAQCDVDKEYKLGEKVPDTVEAFQYLLEHGTVAVEE